MPQENKDLCVKYLTQVSRNLKTRSRSTTLSERNYSTLSGIVSCCFTVDGWFNHKLWKRVTRKDIQRVFEQVEQGVILSKQGKPFKRPEDYYNRIMKWGPFKLIGKDKLVREVIGKTQREPDPVRFVTEEDFRKVVSCARSARHKAFYWMLFDIGENEAATRKLRTTDFQRQVNEVTGKPEYVVKLRNENIKASRTARSEITNYDDTVAWLDQWLGTLAPGSVVFDFTHEKGRYELARCAKMAGVSCHGLNDCHVTPKDLRSSMICDLLSKGWSVDDVKARAGHKPGSSVINRYADFIARNRNKMKNKYAVQAMKQEQEEKEAPESREHAAQESVGSHDAEHAIVQG